MKSRTISALILACLGIVISFVFVVTKIIVFFYISFAAFVLYIILMGIQQRSAHKELQTIKKGLSTIFSESTDNQHDDIISEQSISNDVQELLAQVLNAFAVKKREFEELKANMECLESVKNKLIDYQTALDPLCSVHLPVDLTPRWNAMIESNWSVVSKEALVSLDKIKSMNDQNQEFIQDLEKEFGIQQDNFIEFSEIYSKNITDYARKAGIIRTSFMQSIESSSSRIEETFASFGKVVEIIERIKMISLNMSIEASKVRGSDAFYFLARELRKLATDTEETLSGITMIIQTTLETMHTSKDKQTKEFMAMDEVVQQFEKTLDNYKQTSSKLAEFIQKAIYQIDKNQESQRLILLEFFKNLQRIAIVKEEFEHRIKFESIILDKVNNVIYNLVRKDKPCAGTDCAYRREALEALAKIANTDAERQFVNELFKEYLNEDREQEHGTIGGDGFIQF